MLARLAERGRACSVEARDRRCRGRLAQLAEHLVYTERVGGSSPSPPTSRRRLARAALGLILAFSALLGCRRGFGGFRVDDVPRPAARGGRLRRALSARDRRRRRDRDRHAAGVRRLPQIRGRRQGVASQLCSSIRAAATSSRRWCSAAYCGSCGSPASSDGSIPAGTRVPTVGQCLSACVYAMMGAVRRVAPPGSEVALHRMSIVESEGRRMGRPGARDAQLSPTRRWSPSSPDTRAGWASTRRWCARRNRCRRTPCTSSSREEMRRWSFATSQF